jgi:cytochrome c-type protein NapC
MLAFLVLAFGIWPLVAVAVVVGYGFLVWMYQMQSSKEVWGTIFGTINTRQKFLDERLRLAKHEWARMKSNDSLKCRNCHSSAAMDLSKQAPRAAEICTRYLLSGEATCIDCTRASPTNFPTWKASIQAARPAYVLPIRNVHAAD